MKKIIALLAVLTMVLSLFAGCAASGNTQEPTDESTEESTQESTDESTQESTEESTDETGENPGGDVDVDLNSLESIINSIYTVNPVEFMAMSMPVDITDTTEDGLASLEYMTGLTSAEMLSEAMVSEAAIGAIPYSLVLVRVKDASMAQTVADDMRAGIDQRKWICVEADDLMVVTHGDLVMLVMIGSEQGKAADFVKAFAAVVGEPEYSVN